MTATTQTTDTFDASDASDATPAPVLAPADLLAAGAVLPPGTRGAGPAAVELTARAYRHPALGEDRVVVRLAAAELGAAEDLAAGFLGLEPAEAPAVVGLGRRQALGFPEWVLVHHPEDGHHALAVVPELDRLARHAKSKPKAALDACHELAGRLAAAVPHFLPVFYEQAARIFLAVENTTYAGQLFARARTSEARHGLPVDEDRLDAVLLEFALAGALPVKVLTAYAKELSARLEPAEAFERFRRLCVRRTAGGLAPSAQAATELRRLARAAGLTGTEPEQEYLAELLPLPATLRAAAGWWKTHRSALVALARRVPAVRGTLLAMTPPGDDGELSDLWLAVLEESGATAGLTDADAPEEQRCPDGAAGWLERYHAARHRGWGTRPTPPALLDLVTRAAGRLRAELAARPDQDGALRVGVEDVDLLDLLLALDVPVADPPDPKHPNRHDQLNLADWARGDNPRDLVALAADPRFRPAFRAGAYSFGDASTGAAVMRRLAASPGGRPMLTEWMTEVARNSAASGLPALPDAIRRLAWLPAEALALAPREVAAAAATDVGAILARTLRGGLFEEFTWPAWEEAVAALAPRDDRNGLTVVEAWPYLIVANTVRVHVIDADGTVLTHDLRGPNGSGYRYGFHYVDGALLVFWTTWGRDQVQGYWHTAPDTVLTLDGAPAYWSLRSDHLSLELPGGGRTTGGGVLHRGDTRLPAERELLSDGTSYWVWERDDQPDQSGWAEYDPATGAVGRRSLPAFLADATAAHTGHTAHTGARLARRSARLRPAPTVEGSALGPAAGGLLGWRAVRLHGNGWHAQDTGGRTVTLPEGSDMPLAALAFPGDDRPRALTSKWRQTRITDPDGVVTATADADGGLTGTAGGPLPPEDFWYALRPRDPRGSAALRAADDAATGTLLKAAAAAGQLSELPGLVTAAFPELTAPELLAGVVRHLRFALAQQKSLDSVAARLDPSAAPAPVRERGPADRLVGEALGGVFDGGYYRYGSDADVSHLFLTQLETARADTTATAVPGRLHFDLPSLPYTGLPFADLLDEPAVLAYRAAVPGIPDDQREALLTLLARADALDLTSVAGSAPHWRRLVVHLDAPHLRTPDGAEHSGGHRSVLPLGGGAALGITEYHRDVPDGREYGALLHDPEGRFEVPGPYTVRGTAPVGDRSRPAGWAAAFLAAAREHGTAPYRPEAAAEFSRLTGASGALAALVVAGMPGIGRWERNFLPADLRATLGLKVAEAAAARDELRAVPQEVRRAVLAALLPAAPEELWTRGPDAAAAADLWNARVGRRTPVPDWLAAEATRAVSSGWPAHRALPALLDPAGSHTLSTDVDWRIDGDRATPAAPATDPFTSSVLTGAMATAGWLAHRLPAGDPHRAALPSALTALRARLAAPGLLLAYGHYVDLAQFRVAAGTPTETTPEYERYGAVFLSTHDGRPQPAVRPALLDSTGSDPYLAALRGEDQRPGALETALRLARDPAFARLLADPGAPVAGEAGPDGTWWPQDPSRSVPGLVAEASAEHGLGTDAAALYLMLLAMPDPTDRNTARWTGWKPARLKAARAELAATDLVVSGDRRRAGRTLFLPGGWADLASPGLPVEEWKLPMFGPVGHGRPVLGALVPHEPPAELYARAWQRTGAGDRPRFEELKVKRTRRRR
ncbi:DNA-binding protein [Streptomyces sp. NPDC012888]|uniref:DNA-binding protein n=1 Tax=Streptomyces sp. NPDC012888 TaxID=3364855 RepID=UPI0036C82EAE